MMYPRILLLATALIFSSASSAVEMDLELSDDTARFMYLTEAFGQDFGRLELEAGFLYSKNGDNLLNLGLLVRGESVSVPLIVSVGARLYYAKLSQNSVGAITIGGDLLLSPESWGGFGLGAFFYTAPGVVSFGDASGLAEYGAYVNFQITPQATFAGGYRHIDVDITNSGTLIIDEGVYFGVNLSF